MEKTALYLLLLFSWLTYGQRDTLPLPNSHFVITPEISIGITADANSLFPEHGLQKQLLLNLGWEHDYRNEEWAQRLKGPRTGISFGITDFDNSEKLGYAFSAMPFIEFNAFRSNRLKVQVATGASYFSNQYDSIQNPNNQAVTTNVTWSFKMFSWYQLSRGKTVDWRAGLGYFHHSNGHTRLPNQGFNSFLVSLAGDLHGQANFREKPISEYRNHGFEASSYTYSNVRYGLGYNVLAKPFNERAEVHTISAELGRVYNKTYKVGIGMYYRFYRSYYDYIKGNESLVQEGREFASYRENPLQYASNIGVTAQGEVLLNHFGISLQLGLNLYKPGYKIDWRINQGWSYVPRVFPEVSNVVLGEFNTKYRLKQLISSRLGLKYYLLSTHTVPTHNLYLGCFINSNLGQADFTEASIGYVHNFNLKKKIGRCF